MRIVDIRAQMPRAPWSIGQRRGHPESGTLHYFGPGAPNYSDDATAIRAMVGAAHNRHMASPAAGGLGADGLQYHYVIPASGTVYRTRDERDMLWHCANTTGNRSSIAVHLPLDSTHDATPAQWAAATALFDDLIRRYGWAGRDLIRGHREWPRRDGKAQSPCPGPLLTRRLKLWRGQLAAGIQSYRVVVDRAVIREGPGQAFRVALGGTAKLSRGEHVSVDAVVVGAAPKGSQDPRWAHRADGIGFVHIGLLEARS